MATTSARIIKMLGALNSIQQVDVEFARHAAYDVFFATLTREDLIGLAAVLAEGNAFGADAARRLAGVA